MYFDRANPRGFKGEQMKKLFLVLALTGTSCAKAPVATHVSPVQTSAPQPFVSNPVAPPEENDVSLHDEPQPEPTPTPEPLQKAYKSFETPFVPHGS